MTNLILINLGLKNLIRRSESVKVTIFDFTKNLTGKKKFFDFHTVWILLDLVNVMNVAEWLLAI